MEWTQIRDVILQGALSEDVIRTAFRQSAAACASAEGGGEGQSPADSSSDYLYPQKKGKGKLGQTHTDTPDIIASTVTTHSATAAINMTEFSSLMARLELLYEEGSDCTEEQRSDGQDDWDSASEGEEQGDVIADDVREVYMLLVGGLDTSNTSASLSYAALVAWSKMQEALTSGFVSEKTTCRLFDRVMAERQTGGTEGLSLQEFDRFCFLLQASIDRPSDEDGDREQQSGADEVSIPMDTGMKTVDEAVRSEERADICSSSVPRGVSVSANTDANASLESTRELPIHKDCSDTVTPADPVATSPTSIPHDHTRQSSPQAQAENLSCDAVAVLTDLDTSIIGYNDISMLSCEDRLQLNESCGGLVDNPYDEVSFLQMNTYLDATGVLRVGQGVSMAGDLFRKAAPCTVSVGCVDISMSTTATYKATWQKVFFALREFMLTYFDEGRQKIVAVDVRECKARPTTTPRILRQYEPEGFKFVVISKGKCMYFIAKSEGERAQWIEKINEHMHNAKGSFLVL